MGSQLWLVSSLLFDFLGNSGTLGKSLLGSKGVPHFSVQLLSETSSEMRAELQIGLHVKYSLLFSDCASCSAYIVIFIPRQCPYRILTKNSRVRIRYLFLQN